MSNIQEMIKMFDSKEVVAEWDRRDQLLKRFNGLKQTTLADYQREMESMDDFKDGILKPTHSVTFIHIATFVDYLRWKQSVKYRGGTSCTTTRKTPI